MKRKIVKLGPSTLVVSLPSKWIKRQELKAGDEIEVDDKDSQLVLNGKGEKKKTEATIDLHGLNESAIRTLVTNTYRLGYDKVMVHFENNDQYENLKQVVKTRLI